MLKILFVKLFILNFKTFQKYQLLENSEQFYEAENLSAYLFFPLFSKLFEIIDDVHVNRLYARDVTPESWQYFDSLF